MKKLLVIIPAFPADEATSFMVPFPQQFLLGFKEKYSYVSVTVISLHYPAGDPYDWNGIKIIPLKRTAGTKSFKVFSLFRNIRKSIRVFKSEQFDGILSFWYSDTAFVGSILSKLFRVKHYVWLLGQDVTRTNPFMKWFRPNPHSLFAISEFQNDFFFKEFGIRAHKVLFPAVKDSLFPKQLNAVRNIDILGVGSLIPLKNYRFFLEVIVELVKDYPTLKALLLGTGPLERELRQFIDRNNLANNVTLGGLRTHRETLTAMNDAKILLHTSVFEGGGTVYFEGLYSGCQVISMIPIIMDPTVTSFHYLEGKDEIVSRISFLLKDPPAPRRIVYVTMDKICSSVYESFFLQ